MHKEPSHKGEVLGVDGASIIPSVLIHGLEQAKIVPYTAGRKYSDASDYALYDHIMGLRGLMNTVYTVIDSLVEFVASRNTSLQSYSDSQFRDLGSFSPDYVVLHGSLFGQTCCDQETELMQTPSSEDVGQPYPDLVGIETNPGPKKKTKGILVVTAGQRSQSERHPGMLMVQTKKQKKKKINKLPSISSRNSGGHISASIFDMRAYRAVLDNPFDMTPVRLGGETMVPSGLATLVSRFPFGISSTGVASVCAYPVANAGGFNFLTSLTSASPYTYGVPAGAVFPGSQALINLSAEGRIVAAGIRVFSLSSSTNNQGAIVIGCVPRDTGTSSALLSASGFPLSSGTTATQGVNEFQDYLSTETYPLKDGATAVYRPQDPVDFTFRGAINGVNPLGTLGVGSQLVPFFVIGVNGGAPSSVLWIEFVTHIEYTVNTGSAGIINTGLGNMNSVDSFGVAKSLFGNIYDTTMKGVVGGLSSGATLAGRAIGQTISNSMQGAFFSSTVS